MICETGSLGYSRKKTARDDYDPPTLSDSACSKELFLVFKERRDQSVCEESLYPLYSTYNIQSTFTNSSLPPFTLQISPLKYLKAYALNTSSRRAVSR